MFYNVKMQNVDQALSCLHLLYLKDFFCYCLLSMVFFCIKDLPDESLQLKHRLNK